MAGRPAKIARVRELAVVCIPKNGNSSIKRALLRGVGVKPPWDEHGLHRHPSLNLGADPEGRYTAAFLRHPAARLVSCWADKICRDRGRSTRHLVMLGFRVGMGFPAFARHATRVSNRDVHLRPQSDFLPKRLDFIGRVETLDRDWARLQERFPWLPDIGRYNETVRGAWEPHCDAETLRVIQAHYSEDWRLCGL